MSYDPHEVFRQSIDQGFAGALSPQQERSLQEHLHSCTECQEYHDASTRVLSSLNGFSFTVDPAHNAKVSAALVQRAHQRSAARLSRRWLVNCSLIAIALTLVGSLAELRLSGVVASLFDMQQVQAQHDLLSFWILPSLCILLVFPLLPLLTAASNRSTAVGTAANAITWKGKLQ